MYYTTIVLAATVHIIQLINYRSNERKKGRRKIYLRFRLSEKISFPEVQFKGNEKTSRYVLVFNGKPL